MGEEERPVGVHDTCNVRLGMKDIRAICENDLILLDCWIRLNKLVVIAKVGVQVFVQHITLVFCPVL